MKPPKFRLLGVLLAGLPLAFAACQDRGEAVSTDGGTVPQVLQPATTDAAATPRGEHSDSENSATMDRFQGKQRPLLIFAPDANDLRYVEQKSRIKDHADAMTERDMVLLEVLGSGQSLDRGEPLDADQAKALRTRYDLRPADFRIILVGKDGGEKVRWFEPVNADDIFAEVDKMPMRRDEMEAGKAAAKDQR